MSVYQVGPACYGTAKAAAQAWASGAQFAPVSIGTSCTGVLRYSVTGTDASPVVSTSWTRVSGSCTVPASTAVQWETHPCQLWTQSDGIQAAWLIAGAWIAAKCVVWLTRAIKR